MKVIPISAIWLVFLLLFTNTSKSQEIRIERSVFGIQTGFWGVWAHHEARLSSSWALRTEVGMLDYYEYTEELNFEPIISIAPRWYFNLAHRLEKGRRIDANSGRFLALKISFRPDIFHSHRYHPKNNWSVRFVPTMGHRLNIGEKFNYEFGFGLGVQYFSKEGFHIGLAKDESPPNFTLAVNLHLRIGLHL